MTKKPESRIVLALDQMSKARALKIAEEASGHVWGFKVHDLLFHYGAEMVYELSQFGKVIADAKLFGSREEVYSSIRIFRSAGADIITVGTWLGAEESGDDLAGLDLNYGYDVASFNSEITFLVSKNGADLHVVGRPLIEAENFLEEIEKLNTKFSVGK